jgi:hypothetical protein
MTKISKHSKTKNKTANSQAKSQNNNEKEASVVDRSQLYRLSC